MEALKQEQSETRKWIWKMWNSSCISWKEFTMQCYKFLNQKVEDCSTEEEFEEYHPSIMKTTTFLDTQEEDLECPIFDLCTPQQWEKIEDKCKRIYDEVYCKKYNELIDCLNFNMNEEF